MPVPTSHAAHDAALIAGHAAGDLRGTQLLLVDRLLASCEDCARLHADLRTIAAATRAPPGPPGAWARWGGLPPASPGGPPVGGPPGAGGAPAGPPGFAPLPPGRTSIRCP